MEAWEKIYIKFTNKELLSEVDPHLGYESCWGCHGGDPRETEDQDLAHAGFIKDPSASDGENICANCHQAIAKDFSTSMHMTLKGEKNAIAARMGLDSFEECPSKVKDGFVASCNGCHATCGDCHVSRPNSAAQGFIKSHKFTKKPHQVNQCMACHGSRVAHDFLGDDETQRPSDVHFSKGFNCMSCHSGAEMHSPAIDVKDRYHVPEAPRCEDCHDAATANDHHAQHWNDLSCYVCHSQDYNNCASCHVGSWKDDEAYHEKNPEEDFRIGLNPFPDRRYKYTTLRHIPIDQESYDDWDTDDILVNFNVLPTWKYASPHSARRWTARTEVADGASCSASCHLGGAGGVENADIYLTKDYVESRWPNELEANLPVVVDEQLPSGWTTK